MYRTEERRVSWSPWILLLILTGLVSVQYLVFTGNQDAPLKNQLIGPASVSQQSVSQASMGNEELMIKNWLKDSNLNEYGDPKSTMYMGGSPLFNERTGTRKPYLDYMKAKFPDYPWLSSTQQLSADKNNKGPELQDKEAEMQKMKQWIKDNDLDEFGNRKGTMYMGGTPLFDERTGKRVDWYDYMVSAFPDKPWNK